MNHMVLDPRTITDEQIGTKLRDAAVNPVASDYLPPTNAGVVGEVGNPHGPTVVAPGIHGNEGVRPILPGAVSSTAATQEAAETAHTNVWQPATDPA